MYNSRGAEMVNYDSIESLLHANNISNTDISIALREEIQNAQDVTLSHIIVNISYDNQVQSYILARPIKEERANNNDHHLNTLFSELSRINHPENYRQVGKTNFFIEEKEKSGSVKLKEDSNFAIETQNLTALDYLTGTTHYIKNQEMISTQDQFEIIQRLMKGIEKLTNNHNTIVGIGRIHPEDAVKQFLINLNDYVERVAGNGEYRATELTSHVLPNALDYAA